MKEYVALSGYSVFTSALSPEKKKIPTKKD